jgi:hypothetical protein
MCIQIRICGLRLELKNSNISTDIMFLDIIHRPVFILNYVLLFI